jgi:signal transduction histidine kinase
LEELRRRSGIEGEFLEEDLPREIPDAVKTCVYRAVQEALHNCEKHSGATRVRVSLRRQTDSLVAEVEDNGCGFALDGRRSPPGLGLLGIRERVAAAGGSIEIHSTPGRGVRVAMRIPLAVQPSFSQAAV